MPAADDRLRYASTDSVPFSTLLGQALQHATLCVSSTVFVAIIIFRPGTDDATVLWAVFASLLVCGLTTVVQGVGVLGLGARCTILHNTAALYIAACIAAIAAGGTALMATLVLISAAIQLAVSARLSMLRWLLTPTVSGTVMMLLPVVVMPVLFRMLIDVPGPASTTAIATSAGVTMLTVVAGTLYGSGTVQRWSPALGIVFGTVVGTLFGLYDTERVLDAPWAGLPAPRLPGIDLDFGPAFWAHLPLFAILALVLTAKAVAGAVGTWRVSQRGAKAVDYRAVQGAAGAEGIGNLFAGWMGTAPITTYLVSVSLIEFTGVAARTVGIACGAMFIALAFFPKALAIILAIPAPVIAASVMMTMVMLFVGGVREVVGSGLDMRKSLIVGFSFWTGVAFENDWVFAGFFAEFAGGILSGGMSAGCLAAMTLTALSQAARPRRKTLRCSFDLEELPRINAFLAGLSERLKWPSMVTTHLQAAAEEALLVLSRYGEEDAAATEGRRLRLSAYREGASVVLEIVTVTDERNLQDRIALLGEVPTDSGREHEAALRMLRSITSDVRHEQYSNADIVTIRIDLPNR